MPIALVRPTMTRRGRGVRQRRLHLADAFLDRDQLPCRRRRSGAAARVLDGQAGTPAVSSSSTVRIDAQRIAVAVVGVDQQRQLAAREMR